MLGAALGVLGWTQGQFWDSTYYEFVLASNALNKHLENQNRTRMMISWYDGMFAQANLKKYPLKKWLRDIEPAEARIERDMSSKRVWDEWEAVRQTKERLKQSGRNEQ